MKPRSIEEMWEAYSAMVGLGAPDVTPQRYEDARHAFIAGLLDMFAAIGQVSELPEEEADKTVAAWNVEFTAYATDLATKAFSKRSESA